MGRDTLGHFLGYHDEVLGLLTQLRHQTFQKNTAPCKSNLRLGTNIN